MTKILLGIAIALAGLYFLARRRASTTALALTPPSTTAPERGGWVDGAAGSWRGTPTSTGSGETRTRTPAAPEIPPPPPPPIVTTPPPPVVRGSSGFDISGGGGRRGGLP